MIQYWSFDIRWRDLAERAELIEKKINEFFKKVDQKSYKYLENDETFLMRYEEV